MRIYPAMDIRDGKVVRLIQGDYDRQIDYATDPERVAAEFRTAGTEWIHMVDLDGAKTGATYNFDVLAKILKAGPVKVQVGGGIRSRQTIQRFLDAGAERVIIGTRGIEDWDWFQDMAHAPEFSRRIVLGLDARNGMLASHGWIQQTIIPAVDIARKVSTWPLAAIVYTDIAKDGMLEGPNFEQVERMAEATDVPVIASGGVTSLDDVHRLCGLPIDGMIIGRALYEGKLNLAQALAAAAA